MFRLLAALVVPAVVALVALTLVPDARTGAARLVPVVELPAAARAVTAAPVEGPLRPPTATSHRAASAAARARLPHEGQLAVSIDALSPAVVPRRGRVVLRGRVTNHTAEEWADVTVAPCTSVIPIRTSRELAAATESDEELVVCSRHGFFPIGDLAPGQTRRYTMRIPVEDLQIPAQEGVYWLNVHALGTNDEGRDTVSDGRARTFVTRVGARRPPVETTVVVPVRRVVGHDPDGKVADVPGWTRDLRRGGRLSNVIGLAESADAVGAALLLDPAVVDAARRIAEGNPPRRLGPVDEDGETEEAEAGNAGEADRRTAQEWLERLRAVAADHSVYALPYGDLDVAAAARHDPTLYERARRQSEAVLDDLDIPATPAVAPPDGLLGEDAVGLTEEEALVLLSHDALPEPYAGDDDPPATVVWDDHRIAVYDEAVAAGGPAPGNRQAAVAARQRILAEAAIRAIHDDTRPLVVALPADVDPGGRTGQFFPGLDQPFVLLDGTPLEAELDLPEVDGLVYPERRVSRELEAGNVDRANALVDAGSVLDSILPGTDELATVTLREALAATSYQHRPDRYAAAAAAEAATAWLRRRLQEVQIEAPRFVILSSESGPFPLKLSNGLDQSVQVRIRAHTQSELTIRAPEQITLPPQSQQTINLTAQAGSIGVHSVTLVATDGQQRPIGASEQLNIRTNQVGRAIWVVMGVGVAILFLAIAVRLTRRWKGARSR